MISLRSTKAILLVAGVAILMPTTAQAQACSSAQLGANPLVSMGYQAYARINNSVFNLSCHYVNYGGGLIAFDSPTQVAIGSGFSATLGSILDASFYTVGSETDFAFLLGTTIRQTAAATADFAFGFAAPINTKNTVSAQVGITRAAGNGTVTPVTAGSGSTFAGGGGAPAWVIASTEYIVSGIGSTQPAPMTLGLGLDLANDSCTSVDGTACSFDPVTANFVPSAGFWGTVISFRQTRLVNAGGTNVAATIGVNGELVADSYQEPMTAVPEPAALTLVATGLIGIIGAARRRKRV